MVQIQDVQSLVGDLPDEQAVSKTSLLNKYELPIHYLDFAHVAKCTDAKELEKILEVLQSGEEGHYPQLIEATEARLGEIKPSSRLIRKAIPVLSKHALQKDELSVLSEDMTSFLNEVKKNDKELQQSSSRSSGIPTVRKTKVLKDNNNNKDKDKVQSDKRIKSTDYESWDKYDVDTEILKMDLKDEKLKDLGKQMEEKPRKDVDKKTVRFNTFATEAEAHFEAEREKEKGNEYFKAGDYQEAFDRYTNSITFRPNMIVFNNRAITLIRLKRYQEAIADCNKALKYDSNNIKAHLRLAQSYVGLQDYVTAWHELEIVIKLDPNNNIAQNMINDLKKLANTKLPQKHTGKKTRMKIVEIEDEPKITSPSKTKKQSKIIEVKSKLPKIKRNYEIIPVPGTSKMNPPYYKKVHSTNPEIIKREQRMINNVPQLLYMTSIYNNSDEDDDCDVIHIEPRCPDKNNGSVNEIENLKLPDKKRFHCENGEEKENCGQILNSSERKVVEILTEKEHRVEYLVNNNNDENKKNMDKADNKKIIKEVENVDIQEIANRKIANVSMKDNGGGGEPYVNSNNPPPEDAHMPYIFLTTWNSIRSDVTFTQHASVLQTLDLRTFPRIIGNKLDGTMLSEIIQTIYQHFTVADQVWRAHDAMSSIPNISRFNIVIMFMAEKDRTHINNILEFLEQHGQGLSAEVKSLYSQ